jgi:hypothetical protein
MFAFGICVRLMLIYDIRYALPPHALPIRKCVVEMPDEITPVENDA